MKRTNLKKGFTLPEVLVAITMIVLIIVTATNLLVSSVRANRTNINNIVAFNLAQEALEGIRNVRDGYWLHNRYWRGDERVANGIFGESFEIDGTYIIEKKHDYFTAQQCTQSGSNINQISTVASFSPWNIEKITSSDDLKARLFIEDLGDVSRYTHNQTDDQSLYKRWLEIKTIPYELSSGQTRDDVKISVTAVVEWNELSRTKQVRVPTILTDWKAGPL
jgi:prepilin-type N-terminal cleavage/methylation domain-containing protein